MIEAELIEPYLYPELGLGFEVMLAEVMSGIMG